jgi:DNA-binding NarL/FixJ family response regulator
MNPVPVDLAAQSLRALIVDDDPRWRAIVAEILSELGWSITALAAPPDDVRGYQLAVLDIALDPVMARNRDGLKLARQVSAQGTPCVVLSGLEDDELAAQIKLLPHVLEFMPKTAFRRDVFINLVRQIGAPAIVAAPQILIVEDDARWRAIYEEVLSDEGYVLRSAISYGEARGWLQREEIALAIVDLQLISSAAPQDNRDGFWLLRAAHQRRIPTIVVSALGAPDDIDRAYEEFNVFAFVEKEGFDRREFRTMIADALHAHRLAVPTAEAAPDQRSPADSALAELTERERDVLELLAKGYTNRQIAEQLGITANTVKKHVDHILQKLQVSTRAAAVAVALRAERS